MGYICDQIGFQPFTLHPFFHSGIQPLANGVDLLADNLLFSAQLFCRNLIIHFAAGDFHDSGFDLFSSNSFMYKINQGRSFCRQHKYSPETAGPAQDRDPMDQHKPSKHDDPPPQTVQIGKDPINKGTNPAKDAVFPQISCFDPPDKA